MAPTEREFAELIQNRLKVLNTSAIRAARSSGLSRDAIRAVIRGRSPSYKRTREICLALGLHFDITIPDTGSKARASREITADGPETAIPDALALTRFRAGSDLNVRHMGLSETRTPAHQPRDGAPAPIGLTDPHGFYAVAGDDSLRPARIEPGDYVLVLPNDQVRPRDRVWVRELNGETESLRWLVNWWDDGFEVMRWEPSGPETPERPRIHAEQLPKKTTEVARIAAVYRGRPSVERGPMKTADWP